MGNILISFFIIVSIFQLHASSPDSASEGYHSDSEDKDGLFRRLSNSFYEQDESGKPQIQVINESRKEFVAACFLDQELPFLQTAEYILTTYPSLSTPELELLLKYTKYYLLPLNYERASLRKTAHRVADDVKDASRRIALLHKLTQEELSLTLRQQHACTLKNSLEARIKKC